MSIQMIVVPGFARPLPVHDYARPLPRRFPASLVRAQRQRSSRWKWQALKEGTPRRGGKVQRAWRRLGVSARRQR